MDEEITLTKPVELKEVEVTTDGGENGKVVVTQPIPEDPSECESDDVIKKRSNMVGRGEYGYTTKVTSTSTHRTDDRCANWDCHGDGECTEVLFGCLLCHCLFGGDSNDSCGDCCSACDCKDCGDCDCGNCDCGDCGNCDCNFS
nr:uncharacterized protein LOC129263530 [Lytechinus pictus]